MSCPKKTDTERCIEARNKLNAAIHGEGAVIDSLEDAVAYACAIIRERKASFPVNDEGSYDELFAKGDH